MNFLLLFFVLIGIFGALVIYVIVLGSIRSTKRKIIAKEVCVIAKRKNAQFRSEDRLTVIYSVTFRFPDKSRHVFQVDRENYKLLREGDRGILWYQGNSLLRFQHFRRYPKRRN